MKKFNWDLQKNQKLIKERNISFEQILLCIENKKLLDIVQNPSSKHPEQRCLVVDVNEYCYLVPFIENAEEYFLKTIIPSRKLTRLYLNKEENHG